MIQVVASRNPFAPLTKETAFYAEKMTVSKALELHPMPEHYPFVCVVNGQYILRSDNWDTYEIPEDGLCLFFAVAQGGGGQGQKNPLATILTLVVLAAVTWGAGAIIGAPAVVGVGGAVLAPATGLTAAIGGLAAHLVVGIASALVVAGASYLINMALPPSFSKPPDAPDPAYSIIGRSNQARLGAPQEVGFGRTKFYPSICAAAYREFSNSFVASSFADQAVGDQTLFEIYNIGWGYYDIELYDLLNQDLENFPEIVIQKFEPGELITSFPAGVIEVPAVSELYLEYGLSKPITAGHALVTTVYDGSDEVDEQQNIIIEQYKGGNFRLRFKGTSTSEIDFDPEDPPTAQQIQDELEDISTIGHGNVRCEGGPLGTAAVAVTFIGDLGRTPLPTLEIDIDDLTLGDKAYPFWGRILHGGYDTIVESGTENVTDEEGVPRRLGYFEVDDDIFGLDDSLVGHLCTFRPRNYFSNGIMKPTYGTVAVTIAKNTGNRVYWEIPSDPTMLRDVLGRPVLPATINDPGYVAHGDPDTATVRYDINEIANWKGGYKINPNESSDLINEIAVDIILPEGLNAFDDSNGKHTPMAAGWRIEYQKLDDDGDPLEGLAGRWKPLVTDPRYSYTQGIFPENGFPPGCTIFLQSKSFSPIRFTIKQQVADGRYAVRVMNAMQFNSLNFFTGSDRGVLPENIPPGYPPSEGMANSIRDIEDGSKNVHAKSYWTGLRGYATKAAHRWEDRTIVTVRVTATDNVNSNTLQQFGVLATRKLQDYIGVIEDGVLPASPFRTKVFSDVRTIAPDVDPTVPLPFKTSQINAAGIGLEFKKGDYVRLSGFVDDAIDNNAEWLVVKSTANVLIVRGVLVAADSDPAQIAGSRRVYAKAPEVLTGVAVTGINTITKTGIGLLDAFQIGNKVTLQGFDADENNVKCDIVGRTNDTLTVSQDLVVESAGAGKSAHSAPPFGLVGVLLDGARALFSNAEEVGGIAADKLNYTEFDNVAVVITGSEKITTLEAADIGDPDLNPLAVVGTKVTLVGYAAKQNHETVLITKVEQNKLTVTTPPSEGVGDTPAPVPKRSSLVAEAAAVGKKIVFGAREVFLTGDTEFYFYADEGATSEDTGGGTVSYSFPNKWTGLQPSRRISSAAYDLATDRNFGGGVSSRKIDLEGLAKLEVTWDSRDRYESDGITWKKVPVKDRYDSRLSERKLIHDIFTEMSRCGRARPLYPSGIMTFIRDEPRAVADVMYTGRNIIGGSLEHTATFPTEDTPDHVLAQFFNEEFWDFDEVIATFIPYSLSQNLLVKRESAGATFTLIFDGYETDPIESEGVSHGDIETALNALPNVSNGALNCTGNPRSDEGMTITYAHEWLGKNPPLLIANTGDMKGGAVIITYNVNPAWPGVAPARLVMPGVVQRQQAWREAMYELGSAKSRRLLTVFKTDVEGYIPSYLSRVDISHEIGNWGQHGLVTGYEETEGVGAHASIFVSETLVWDQEGDYVMQLRDKMGKPVLEGLVYVIPGDLPNEAIPVDSEGNFVFLDTETIGLHTEHQFLREATMFSFGLVDNHNLKLLVTGIRPNSENEVSIEGYAYRVDGVYDVDGDLQYVPPDESDVLDARQIGEKIKDLKAKIYSTVDSSTGKRISEVRASWAPAAWARHYLVEASTDGFTWKKIEKTVLASTKFDADDFDNYYDDVKDSITVGVVIDPATTIISLLGTGHDPFTAGQHDGRYVLFKKGVYTGQRFLITQTVSSAIVLDTKLTPRPIVGVDTYDIVEPKLPTIYVGVRGFNGVYGKRSKVAIDLNKPTAIGRGGGFGHGGGDAPPDGTQADGPRFPAAVIAQEGSEELFRTDKYGNLFLGGRVFDGQHVTRCLSVGKEPKYDPEDMSVAYLPSAPRTTINGEALAAPSILLFLQDSLLTYKEVGPPGEAEYTFDPEDNKIQLGFDRSDAEKLHYIMISNDDSEALAAIKIGLPCTFTPGTSTATLPFTPVRPLEVLLFLNGDCLFPVEEIGDLAAGYYHLDGTTITTFVTLEATDVLLCLGLAEGQTMEADRFHCAVFYSDYLPYWPLFPTQLAVVQKGTMRWKGTGFSEFTIDPTSTALMKLQWGLPVPTDGEAKYAIMMRAKA